MHFKRFTVLALKVLLVSFTHISLAQDWIWQRDDLILNPSGIDLNDATSWAWGDISGDGITDVLLRKDGRSAGSRLELWRGLPSEKPPYWAFDADFNQKFQESYTSRGITIIDLDGDGELNLITMAKMGSIWRLLYWYSDSSGIWQADTSLFAGLTFTPPQDPIRGLINTDPSFGDVDTDGDLDMLIIDEIPDVCEGFRYFENTGTNAIPSWRENDSITQPINYLPCGFGRLWSGSLIEVNGDNLLDVVITGTFEFWPFLEFYPGIKDSSGIGWSHESRRFGVDFPDRGSLKLLSYDVNNDSYNDLVQLEWGSSGRLFLADPQGENYFNNDYFHIGFGQFRWIPSVLPFDYNRDDDLDLFITGYFYTLDTHYLYHSYEKDVLLNRNLWRNTHWFSLRPGVGPGQFLDINLNGQIDFITSSPPRLYENPDPQLQAEWVRKDEFLSRFLTPPDTSYLDLILGDLNGDRAPDAFVKETVLTGSDSGETFYAFFENEISLDSIIWKRRTNWLEGIGQEIYHKAKFADLDLDSDLDLVFGMSNGTLELFENTGKNKPFWTHVPGAFDAIAVDSLANPSFADIDGDGRDDLFIGNAAGEIFFYRNESTVAVKSAPEPTMFRLQQNYPNPFKPATTIEYDLAKPGRMQLTIYNLLGQRVRTLVEAWQPAGSYRVSWDGSGERGAKRVASGVYVYELKVGEKVIRKKMVVLR